MKNNSKFNKGFVVPVIIAIIAILVAGGAYVAVKKKNAQNAQQAEIAGNINATTTGTIPVGQTNTNDNQPNATWKTYANTNVGFTIDHPANWQVKEVGNGVIQIINLKRQGKSDTDQPTEKVELVSKVTVCTPNNWAEGFGLINYKTTCLRSSNTFVQVREMAFDEEAKKIEDKIISSFKFTSGSQVCSNGATNYPHCNADLPFAANWKTYTNTKYGFELKYPADWSVQMRGAGEAVSANSTAELFTVTNKEGTDSVSFDIAALGSDRLGSYYASAKNLQEYLNLLQGRKFVKVITIAGQVTYWYQTTDGRSQIYWQKGNNIYEVGINPSDKKVSNQVLSTFKYVDGVSSETTNSPSITSITQSSAIGGIVEVKGTGFSGFEGDKNLWIENSTGVKAVVYGERGSSDTSIKFTLAGKYCTTDTSNSGLPCPSYLSITPGVYKIYTAPWGVTSNKVNFVVTAITN